MQCVQRKNIAGWWRRRRNTSGRAIFSRQCISRRLTSPYEGSLLNAYRVLRTTNPSPYMVYMHIDGDGDHDALRRRRW